MLGYRQTPRGARCDDCATIKPLCQQAGRLNIVQNLQNAQKYCVTTAQLMRNSLMNLELASRRLKTGGIAILNLLLP